MKTGLTKKSIYLILLGVIPLAITLIIGFSHWIFVLYNMLLLILLLVDIRLTPTSEAIDVQRLHEDKLRMGTDNIISITVSNKGQRGVRLAIRDMVPLEISSDFMIINLNVGSHDQTVSNYAVHPMKRGKFEFGYIYLKITGVLGLFQKEYCYKCNQEICVYPDLSPMKRHILLARNMLRGSGSRKRRIQGIALDFRGLRDYCSDDTYKAINWNASARVFSPIVNVFDIEKSQSIILAVDVGRTMFDSYKGFTRLDYCISSALILARIIEDRGDKTGLVVYSSRINTFIKPDRGIHLHNKLVETLYGIHPEYHESDLKALVSILKGAYRERSLILIFSALPDVAGAKEMLADLKIIQKQHGIMLISPQNPGVLEIMGIRAEKMDDVLMKAAAVRAKQQQEAAAHILSSAGIHVVVAEPDKLVTATTAVYTSLRSRVGYV